MRLRDYHLERLAIQQFLDKCLGLRLSLEVLVANDDWFAHRLSVPISAVSRSSRITSPTKAARHDSCNVLVFSAEKQRSFLMTRVCGPSSMRPSARAALRTSASNAFFSSIFIM